MDRIQRPETEIRLGRGRPLSPEGLRSLWLALTSRSLVNDWVRLRFLAMVMTSAVLTWGLVSVLGLARPGWRVPGDASGPAAVDQRSRGLVDPLLEVQHGQTASLRDDLFKAPRMRQDSVRKEPRTNPVELLSLIELQGVLGGARPRAMILYKQTQETVTVSVHDDLGEFQVEEIRERSVVLKWRDELFELSL